MRIRGEVGKAVGEVRRERERTFPRGIAGLILQLQRTAGNRAVSRIVGQVQRVTLRTNEGQFHINDYHFLHLYRYVNSRTIGESSTPHIVLLDDFHDWNGLANTATKSKVGDFKYAEYKWKRKGKEVFPTSGGNTVQLTGEEIQTLVSFFNDGVEPPAKQSRDFKAAMSTLQLIGKQAQSTELAVQVPEVRGSGVAYKIGKIRESKHEFFFWGPGGDAEYPHIHCFATPDREIYSAVATLGPAGKGSTDKRHFNFTRDLRVHREDALPNDEQTITMLESVMKSVALGGDFVAKLDAPEEEQGDTPEEEQGQGLPAALKAWGKTQGASDEELAWVNTLEIPDEELTDWTLGYLKESFGYKEPKGKEKVRRGQNL